MMDELNKRNKVDMKNLAQEMVNENAVLFIGAGMSLNAVPIHDHVSTVFQDWTGFMMQLAGKLWSGSTEDELYNRVKGNYLYITQLFKERFGDTLFYKEFLQAVPTEDYVPSQIHQSLLSLPWMEYVTTNQDDLIEKGLDLLKIPYQRVVNDLDVTFSIKKRLMKLHGSWERPESFIFAEEDYRTYEQKHPILALRLKQLFAERTVFFVGYSLQDEDFRNLFGWVRDILGPYQKKAYAYIPNVDLYDIQYWEKRHLHVISDQFNGHDKEEKKLLFQQHLQEKIACLDEYIKLERAKKNIDFDKETNYSLLKSLVVDAKDKEFVDEWLMKEEERNTKRLSL